MNFILFMLFTIIIFMLALIGYKKFHSSTLYALAIGGIVNANFFHAGLYPINCFGLPFGIDSIIYTLFVFCVILMFFQQGKKSAYTLAISSVVAILFSAIMQLIAELFTTGSQSTTWFTFLTFFVSAAASIIAIVITLEILDKIKDKTNNYIKLIVGLLLHTLINTAIYYPLSMLINGTPSNIGLLVLASFIGKLIATICAIFTLFLLHKLNKRS